MAERFIQELEPNATAVAHKALAVALNDAIDVLNLATKLHANDAQAKKLSKATMVRLLLL